MFPSFTSINSLHSVQLPEASQIFPGTKLQLTAGATNRYISEQARHVSQSHAVMADLRWQQTTPEPVDAPRLSKVPTGLGAEPLNIVILGASYAGLSCAHHFLDHTTSRLRITSAAPNYRLVIINPSTHLYWYGYSSS